MDVKTVLIVVVIAGVSIFAFRRNMDQAAEMKQCADTHQPELAKKRAELNKAKRGDILVIDDTHHCYVSTIVPDSMVVCAQNHRAGNLQLSMQNGCGILIFKRVVTPDQQEFKQIESRPE